MDMFKLAKVEMRYGVPNLFMCGTMLFVFDSVKLFDVCK